MSLRAPLLSIFRPQHPIDQTVLAENRKLLDNIDRRHVLKGTLSLGALTLLTGCDVTDRPAVQAFRALLSRRDVRDDLARRGFK